MTSFRAGYELAAITTYTCHTRNESSWDVSRYIKALQLSPLKAYREFRYILKNQLHQRECFKFSFFKVLLRNEAKREQNKLTSVHDLFADRSLKSNHLFKYMYLGSTRKKLSDKWKHA